MSRKLALPLPHDDGDDDDGDDDGHSPQDHPNHDNHDHDSHNHLRMPKPFILIFRAHCFFVDENCHME